jgi:carbamoyltransferase
MTKIKESGLFEDMHVAVAPTDAGSALGAAGATYYKKTGNDRLKWTDAFLGHDMGCTINPKEVVAHLLKEDHCGIASGRAEYGPRALGNRSLIADPRKDIKDTVNKIKRRQAYRPFAPSILEEFADEYFEGPMNEYMQYQAVAKHDYKSVTHVDGTARVQIVKKDSTSIFRKIIEEYYEQTGVPMLLNTSLNIRGKPMVNTHEDAKEFENTYGTKVFV